MKKFLLVLLVSFLSNVSFAQITLSVATQDVSCFGGANGSATLTVSGGTAPYTYSWTPGGFSGATVNNLAAGTYTVIVQDQTASTASVVININQPAALVSTPTFTTPSCFGMCNGAASVMVSGGTAPYLYLWGTMPTQTTQTVGNLCAGSYTVQVTDANNCTSFSNLTISQPPPLNTSINSNNVSCGGTCDGSTFAQVFGGTVPYTFNWTPGGSTSLYQPNLCPGTYTLDVIDMNGCFATATTVIASTGNGPLTGVTPTLTVYNESCYLSGDGSLDLQIGGSNPGPFTYNWNTGATTQDLINVSTNYYTVMIFDAAMNCLTLSDTVMYDGTNCGTITGNLYIDMNTDCIKNSGDIDYTHAVVMANPGNRYAYPDAVGNYTFYSVPYATYSLTTSSYTSVITPTCSTTYTTAVSSGMPNSTNNNFAFASSSPTQPDITVWAYSNGIVPGFNCHVSYGLNNLSLFNGSGIFKATLPSAFIPNITGVSPATYTVSGDTIMWNFANIGYNAYTYFTVYFTVPMGTPLGSSFTTCMWTNTTVTDFNPLNNTYCYSRQVTGSYDPNDKGVNPIGTGPNGNITVNDKELTFLIRFQNTGNGPAVNVVVKDSISSNLDMSTFQMLNASHNYVIDVLPGNEIRWKFNNIMLPDSGSNEPGSHGFIQYRIKQKANNPIGTPIKNTAYIYFDFNDPVITNTTLNTIAAPVGIMEVSNNDNLWSVYPNPSNGLLHITNTTLTIEESQIQIINAIGQVVYCETMSTNHKMIDISKYNSGVYFIKMASDKNTSVKRIILNK